ncbi:drug/metabolite transporter (DMT)-like permease [Psychrobacter luti]|uniref:Drug/metabolite transporter (DMT)-like permease n=1 Tax=Psychrobacter luti TaxID=198481 RepID=A0A839THU1_9GAMM|nr:DMT family transporter [Psychrobacter luti]MBB3107604.1 drug/metabolite transporter (DMT)-like permease [Psychrobacter luti]
MKLNFHNQSKQDIVNFAAPIGFLAIWSGGAICAKVGLQYTDSWSFLFLRSAIALSLLLAIYLKSAHKKITITELKKDQLRGIIFSGLLLQVLYLTFYFSAINTGLSLGIIILVLGIQPIITSLLSANTISVKNLILLAICFSGLVLSTLGYHSINKINALGMLLSVLALLSITFGTIAQAKVKTPPILTLLIQTIFSFFIFLVVVIYKGLSFEVNASSLLSLVWMGAVVSVGAYLLLILMLEYSAADKVSTLFFLLPLLTMILESLVFDSTLSALTIFGAILVCVSLFIYQTQKSS